MPCAPTHHEDTLPHTMRKCFCLRLYASLFFSLLLAAGIVSAALAQPVRQEPTPPPPTQPIESDRLAIPVLPENPTQVEIGQSVYYYNCMPCHGDQGQGLTDEFREVWVDDHQNCWDRGCHGGRIDDEGFPIPRYVPAVSHAPEMMRRYPEFNELLQYLSATHPPQRPGVLAAEEYQAVTSYLWVENDLPLPQSTAGAPAGAGLASIGAFLLGCLTLALALIRQSHGKR